MKKFALVPAGQKRAQERPLHPGGTRAPRAFTLCVQDSEGTITSQYFTASGGAPKVRVHPDDATTPEPDGPLLPKRLRLCPDSQAYTSPHQLWQFD